MQPGARRRRPKLRIVRFRAGPKAHSLRWASSPHRTRFAGLRRGPQLPQAPANGTGGNARPVFALPVQPTAAMSPRIGGSRVGGAPRPFLSHRFLWERKRCPGRAGPLREGGILYERATTGRLRTARRVVAPHGAGGCRGERADDIRPYRAWRFPCRPGFYQTAPPAGLAGKFKQIVNCGGPLFRKRPFLIAFWGAEV